jgi:hypothetical protein
MVADVIEGNSCPTERQILCEMYRDAGNNLEYVGKKNVEMQRKM